MSEPAIEEGLLLHPVAAYGGFHLKGRDRVRLGRELGRTALERSARLTRLDLSTDRDPFPRDAERAPLPLVPAQTPARSDGGVTWRWSTTNTRGLSCAVVAPARVGIDAEWLGRPRLGAALRYLPAGELAATGLEPRRAAFALWSAKEALLKLTGLGMAGMGRTKLVRAPGPGRLTLELDEELVTVRQLWLPDHVVSVACDAPGFQLELDRVAEAQA